MRHCVVTECVRMVECGLREGRVSHKPGENRSYKSCCYCCCFWCRCWCWQQWWCVGIGAAEPWFRSGRANPGSSFLVRLRSARLLSYATSSQLIKILVRLNSASNNHGAVMLCVLLCVLFIE